VINNPDLRQQMGRAGVEGMARFDPKETVSRYLSLINKILG
jgi:hypothetical protein